MRHLAGSLLYLLMPGTMAGIVPWWLTGWDGRDMPVALVIVGIALVIVGATVLLDAFARFAFEGRGTPAPVAPTERLVVSGIYRHVRNPMYIAVIGVISGQALILGRAELGLYALGFWTLTATFVRLYEEPTLTRTYGRQFLSYRDNVPGWLPRLRAWKG